MAWLKLLSLSLLASSSQAQAEGLERKDPVFQAIEKADEQLFGASNTCNIPVFASLIDEDFEFYHDKTGLTVGKQALVESTRKNLCHKVRRTLVRESLKVFPIASYGAIEEGRHMFCNLAQTPVCKKTTNGTGKFFMLWRKRPDGYKLARVISYDHVDR